MSEENAESLVELRAHDGGKVFYGGEKVTRENVVRGLEAFTVHGSRWRSGRTPPLLRGPS